MVSRWAWWCFAAGVAFAACGGDMAQLPEPERRQVNEWMSQRAEAMVEAHRLDDEVRRAWANPAYTTPAVEKLRARHAELQQELSRTQREIQKSVEALPAVAQKVRKLEEARKREAELAQKIEGKAGRPGR